MTDIEPLLQSGSSSRLTSLLRAAAREQPSPQLPQRILVGLGVSATASALTSVKAAAAMTTHAGAASAGSAQVLAPALGVVAAKWIALGLVGGVLAAASLQAATSPTRRSEARGASPAATAPAAAAPSATAPAEPPAAAAPSLEPPQAEPVKAALASPSSDTSGLQLRKELRQIDAARSAIAAGDGARALKELQAYERLAVTHLLDREARVLRIEALMQTGALEQARSLAEAYSAEFPQDAHARRLRALTGASGGSMGSVGDMNQAKRSE